MVEGCPGAANIKGTPTLKVVKCPECGGEIELFSVEAQAVCKGCGFVAYNEIASCVNWCKYVRDCLGDERYEAVVGRNGS